MGWTTGAAIFLVIWWLVLFMVLPWGIQSIPSEDVVKGHAAGAPRRPRVITKMLVTTAISIVLWFVIYWVIDSGLISFRS